jgi:hypothetical protein
MGEIDFNGLKGDVEDITRLFKDNDLDLGRFIKSPKKINVPDWLLYICPAFFIITLIVAIFIGKENANVMILLSVFSISFGAIDTAVIYAKWEKSWFVWISIVTHIVLIAVAFNIMSLEDVINKADDISSKYVK